jgi:hypothetical protein
MVFQCFNVGPTSLARGLRDTIGRFMKTPKRFNTLQNASKALHDASKKLQGASKTLPRGS